MHSFLSIITHEIRTPMNGILHTAQFLHDDILASGGEHSEKIEAVDILQQSSKRLFAFINDLSDFLFLDCTNEKHEEFFSAGHLLDKASVLLDAININKPIVLRKDSVNGDVQLVGEKKRIYQTIILMLLNISKSISKGELFFHLNTIDMNKSITNIDRENPQNESNYKNLGAKLEIKVEVSGKGINCANETYKSLIKKNVDHLDGHLTYGAGEGNRDHIFSIIATIPIALQQKSNHFQNDKYSANDQHFKKSYNKIDLTKRITNSAKVSSDFPTSKRILSKNNLEETVASKFSKKPEFAMALASTTANSKNENETNNEKTWNHRELNESSSSENNSDAVLIIDDEEIGLRMVEMLLQKANINSFKAENGDMALRCFSENNKSIKLVLMDIMLPDTNGYHLFHNFKKINKEIPIVAFSAENSPIEITKMMRHGFYNYLSKPFQKEELLDIVHTVI